MSRSASRTLEHVRGGCSGQETAAVAVACPVEPEAADVRMAGATLGRGRTPGGSETTDGKAVALPWKTGLELPVPKMSPELPVKGAGAKGTGVASAALP
eukprot:1014283-Amphidinium_carterae.2